MSRAGDLRNVTATGTSSEDNYVLTYDDATKKVSLEVAQGGDVVNDTTPQLGGNLDLNSNDITGTGNIDITGTIDVSGDAQFKLLKISNPGGNQMVINNVYSSGIQIRGNWIRIQDATGTSDMIIGKPGYEVELYYNGSQKLETTNTGVTVTGTLTASGTGVIGSSTADTTISGGTPALQVIGSGFNSYLAAVRRDTSQYASGIALVKSRNTSVGSYTIVQDNDQLGSILFIGDDGTDLDTYGATISARVNGTPGANNMPADIEFSTNSGTSSPTLNMKLTKDGVLEGASDAEIKTSPIRIHSNTISTNTTVASNENAVSGGPVTIASGVTVTVSGDWTVV